MWRLFTLLIIAICVESSANELVELNYSFSGNDGDSETIYVDLPANVLTFTVQASGESGDVDLFVYQPDHTQYLDFSFCSNRKQNSNEICQLGTPIAGEYRIEAKAFQLNSSAVIRVTYVIQHKSPSNDSGDAYNLLVLDHIQQVEFKETVAFNTFSHPNRKSLSFHLEQFNHDVLVKVREANNLANESHSCEFILRKGLPGECTIQLPNGAYIIELSALAKNRHQSSIVGKLTAKTEVDQAVLDSAWQDRDVKALKWGVSKTFNVFSSGKSYFFETTPHTVNLLGLASNSSIARAWNGFVLNSLQGDVTMGFELIENLNQSSCNNVLFRDEITCNYNLNSAELVELLRIKVSFPQLQSSILLEHKQTMIEYYTNPSPTCPVLRGCDGDPEI